MSITVSVPNDLLTQLEISHWNSLSQNQQVLLVQRLTAHLNDVGYSLEKPRMERHGLNGIQPVVIWHDTSAHLDFALIPGGSFAPGYADKQLRQYQRVCRLIEQAQNDSIARMTNEQTADLTLEDDEFDARFEKVQLFASKAVCHLPQKPSITVAPFLMYTTFVPASTPGVRPVVDLPAWQSWEKLEADHSAIRLRWPMVDPVLQHLGWQLPTSTEFEWALQAGKPSLFYWGDKLPTAIMRLLVYVDNEDQLPNGELEPSVSFEDLMTREVDPQRPRVYPYCNCFGLASMLAHGTWCSPNAATEDPFPLTLRGGAADCFPWQDCK